MITLNTSIDKPSRKVAFDVVGKALSDLQKTGNETAVINEVVLQQLYKYFTPPLPKKAKTVFDYVAKFAAIKDARYFLNDVYVSDKGIASEVMATNGHMLAWANTSLEPGFYDPKSGAKTDKDARFPDIHSITSGYESAKLDHYDIADLPVYTNEGITVYEIGGLFFQKSYIDIMANSAKTIWCAMLGGDKLLSSLSIDNVAINSICMRVTFTKP